MGEAASASVLLAAWNPQTQAEPRRAALLADGLLPQMERLEQMPPVALQERPQLAAQQQEDV